MAGSPAGGVKGISDLKSLASRAKTPRSAHASL